MTMRAHSDHPIDARPAAATAKAGVVPSCAVERPSIVVHSGSGRREYALIGGNAFGNDVQASGIGEQGWDRYVQRGRNVAHA